MDRPYRIDEFDEGHCTTFAGEVENVRRAF